MLLTAVLVASAAWPGAAHATRSRVVERAGAGGQSLVCPAEVAGLPLAPDVRFAGTERPFADSDGVVERYSFLCPYAESPAASQPVLGIELEWAVAATNAIGCEGAEPVIDESTPLSGRIDSPSSQASVSFVGGSVDDLPAIEEAAESLLAAVPADAAPCEVAAGSSTSSAGSGDGGVPAWVVLAAGAAVLVLLLVGARALLASRRRRSASEAAVGRASHGPTIGASQGPEAETVAVGGATGTGAPEPTAESARRQPDDAAARSADRDRLRRHLSTVAAKGRVVSSHAETLRLLHRSYTASAANFYLSTPAGAVTVASGGAKLMALTADRAASVIAATASPHVPASDALRSALAAGCEQLGRASIRLAESGTALEPARSVLIAASADGQRELVDALLALLVRTRVELGRLAADANRIAIDPSSSAEDAAEALVGLTGGFANALADFCGAIAVITLRDARCCVWLVSRERAAEAVAVVASAAPRHAKLETRSGSTIVRLAAQAARLDDKR